MRRSQAAATLAPPPVQAPAIAAMVGTAQRFDSGDHGVDARS